MLITLKQFIDEYQQCPTCQVPMPIEAGPSAENNNSNHIFMISIDNEILTINVQSFYFVNSDQNEFEFSIHVSNGEIIYGELANQFISLYDLEIILSKTCKQCNFFRSIKIFYDRINSSFNVKLFQEFFSFSHENKSYCFSNTYGDLNKTYIIIGSSI